MSQAPGTPRRALFLLHHYNDIDHAVPVAGALLQAGWAVRVLLYPQDSNNSFNADTDWRLEWLRQRGVGIDRLEQVDPGFAVIDGLLALRQKLVGWCDRTTAVGRVFGRDLRGLLPQFVGVRLLEHAIRVWCERLASQGRKVFARFPADVVVVDWSRAHVMVHPILHEARRRGAGLVELPHGAWTYVGIFSQSNQLDQKKLRKSYRMPTYSADAIAVDNVYHAHRFAARGWAEDRLRLVGLPRFTSAWIGEMIAAAKPAKLPQSGKPRLVWFAGGISHADYQGALAETVAALQAVADRMDIVIKLHTRVPAAERANIGRLLAGDSTIAVVGGEVDSVVLTNWADAVLVAQSSVVYDAFLLGKHVLHLFYTQPIECLWNLFGAGEKLMSAAHLGEVLGALVERRYAPSGGPDAVASFLKAVVFGGLDEAEIIPAHLRLFEDVAANGVTGAGAGLAEATQAWRALGLDLDLSYATIAAKQP